MFSPNASPMNTGRDSDPMPEGYHPRMRLVSARMFKSTTSGAWCFKAKFEILQSDNPLVQPGTYGDVFDQLDRNKFETYDVQAQGRVLALLGAVSGFTPAQANGKVSFREVSLMCDDSQPFTNRIVSGRAKKTGRTNKGEDIVRTEFTPVLKNGQPEEYVEEETAIPANTNAAVPPPPAPAAPAPIDNLARAVAAGWAVHPSNAEFYFKGQEVKSKADLIKGEF